MNENKFRPEISIEALSIAEDILLRQNYVPKSPGNITESGEIELCLAAAVARAGISIINDHTKEKLLHKSLESNDARLIDKTFAKL